MTGTQRWRFDPYRPDDAPPRRPEALAGDAMRDARARYRNWALIPLVASEPWMAAGECRSLNPDLFFGERGENAVLAKQVCAGCPVRVECLEYAIARSERFGVWGGLSPRERRVLVRSRRSAA